MKLVTWNVNSIAIRLPQLLDWLAREQPDVVCLQETKVDDANFPLLDLQAAGYRCAYSGQKSYNGVALLTRAEASDVVYGIDGYEDEQKRVLSASVNGVRIICMYVPNGERVDSDKYRYKLAWLDAFQRWLSRELKTYPLLTGFRGSAPCDVAALEDGLLRVSAMVEDLPQIAELDCNPFMVHETGATILDARIRVTAAKPQALVGVRR